MQGGDGFYLLSEIYKTGFDKILIKLINKGVIYVGVSAGTYITCPTIEMHEWKRKRENHFGLENTEALCLIPFLISVHYEEKYKESILEGIRNTNYQVRILTDQQALLVVDDFVKLVGEGREIKLN